MPTSSEIMKQAKETGERIEQLKKASDPAFLNAISLLISKEIGVYSDDHTNKYCPSFIDHQTLRKLSFIQQDQRYTHSISSKNHPKETAHIISLKGRIFFYDTTTDMVGLNQHPEMPLYFLLLEEKELKKKSVLFSDSANKPSLQEQRVQARHPHSNLTTFQIGNPDATTLLHYYEKTIEKNNPILLKGNDIENMAETALIFSLYQTFLNDALAKSQEGIATTIVDKVHVLRRSLAPDALLTPNQLEKCLKVALEMFAVYLQKQAVWALENYNLSEFQNKNSNEDIHVINQHKKNQIENTLKSLSAPNKQIEEIIKDLTASLQNGSYLRNHRNGWSAFFSSPTNTESLVRQIISVLEVINSLNSRGEKEEENKLLIH